MISGFTQIADLHGSLLPCILKNNRLLCIQNLLLTKLSLQYFTNIFCRDFSSIYKVEMASYCIYKLAL